MFEVGASIAIVVILGLVWWGLPRSGDEPPLCRHGVDIRSLYECEQCRRGDP